LSPWPQVAERLQRRGFLLERLPGEGPEEQENRIATGLMALYRDTREESSFDALYTLARPAVLVWIRGLVGRELGHVDPHEVLQDTFVNVYRYPGAFREDHQGSFRVWVRTIAGNAVRRALVLRSRSTVQELPDEASDVADAARGPVQSILDEEQERSLRSAWILLLWLYAQAYRELSQRDRNTLHLVEVEGLSYREAGRRLAVGRSNMKMIVFRSRRRIVRRMREAMRSLTIRVQPSPDLVA
jgi:RNA polymerase sigma factor (sigma-70 family)